MSGRFTFKKMCERLAARNCYESGQTVVEIANSAKRSPAVIRRWLKESGVVRIAGSEVMKRASFKKGE